MKSLHALMLASTLIFSAAHAQNSPAPEPYGIALEGYAYPYPVRTLPINWEGRALRMAYMDVAPTGAPNGRTAVLLHGRFPR